MIRIYHNPRCKKSRAGLKYIQEKGLEVEIIEYLKNPLSEQELAGILMRMNKNPQDIIRPQEALYKSELKGKNFTKQEWIRILIENPKLIQRPIVVIQHKAILAQPPEKIDELL